MPVFMIPTDDTGGKGSSDSEKENTKGDRTYPDPEEQEESPSAPGAPILDYQFGVSQGWNGDSTIATPSLDPVDPAPIIKLIEPAVDWVKENRIPGLVKALAELAIAIRVPGGMRTLKALTIGTAAMDATYSSTNTAVHLAGGGDSLEMASPLFDPLGLGSFIAEKLRGTSDKNALGVARAIADAHTIVDALAPGNARTTGERLISVMRKGNALDSLQNLGMLSGPAAIPDASPPSHEAALPLENPMCPIRKPGGPFVIKAL